MACGWTPEIMEKIMKIQDMKSNNTEKNEESIIINNELNIIKSRKKKMLNLNNHSLNQNQNQNQNQNHSWTDSYKRWDEWDDLEEIELAEKEKKDKLNTINREKQYTNPCSHDHSAEQKLMDLTLDEKLNKCNEFRMIGNLFFYEGQYNKSSYYYHKALLYFEYMFPEKEDKIKQMNNLKIKILLNYSSVHLRLKKYDEIISSCRQVLELDPNNVKALFKRSQAYRSKDQYDKALNDINNALNYSNDINIIKEKIKIKNQMEAYKIHSKAISKAMFNNNYIKQTKTNDIKMDEIYKIKDNSISKSLTSIISFDPAQPNLLGIESIENILAKYEDSTKNNTIFDENDFIKHFIAE